MGVAPDAVAPVLGDAPPRDDAPPRTAAHGGIGLKVFLEAFRDESDPEGLSHSRAAGFERYTRDVPRQSRVSVRLTRGALKV